MKKSIMRSAIICSVLFFGIESCKKEKITDTTCGCNSSEIRFQLKDISGLMAYNNTARKWYIGYQPIPGYFNNNFICNTTQDSVKKIITNLSTNSTINVTLSGKVKPICSGEDFGVQQGNSSNFYIVIDSLKRN